MSNIISLSDILATAPTLHEYELNGRTILYGDPPAKSLPALQRLGSGDAEGASFVNLYELARTTLPGVMFKDGDGYSEEWFDSVPFSDFMHFLRFRQNPDGAGEQSEDGDPFEIQDLRPGVTLRFPAVTLADIKMFTEYGDALEQLDYLFERVTLPDGSPVPEWVSASLSVDEVAAIITYWINRQKRDEKNAVETKPNGKRAKRGRGKKPSAPSAPSSDTASSPDTPTTSEN